MKIALGVLVFSFLVCSLSATFTDKEFEIEEEMLSEMDIIESKSAFTHSDCTKEGDLKSIRVSNFTHSPKPPVKGQRLSIAFNINIAQEINGGVVKVSLRRSGKPGQNRPGNSTGPGTGPGTGGGSKLAIPPRDVEMATGGDHLVGSVIVRLCAIRRCPVKPGTYKFTMTRMVPRVSVNAGTYTAQASLENDEGKKYFCVRATLKV